MIPLLVLLGCYSYLDRTAGGQEWGGGTELTSYDKESYNFNQPLTRFLSDSSPRTRTPEDRSPGAGRLLI